MLPTPEPARGRAALVVALISVVVAVAAVVGVGLLLLDRRAAVPETTAGPTTEVGAPPTDLALRDDAATITLTWTDPSGGLVPFVVAGGRTGAPLRMMATVESGQTSYTVNGLSSRVDYCFTVLAVYDTDQLATSSQVCTSREAPSTPR
ncbi:fibronectin type III domain-containing protein [Micromonospora endophytica]|uniref:fibronectin type III domain-containing protein n=1 Tax=Micromonospora endophytica TaxID=515350 RepID=UPI003B83006B